MTAEEKSAIQETLMWLETGDGVKVANELKVSVGTVHNVRHLKGKRVNIRILNKLVEYAQKNRTKIMTMVERNKQ